MNEKRLMIKIIHNRLIKAMIAVLVIAATILFACFANLAVVPAKPLKEMAEGCSHMSALQTTTKGSVDFTARYADGNNGIHLDLKPSDRFPGEEDSKEADTSSPDRLTEGRQKEETISPDSVSEDTVSPDTVAEEGVIETGEKDRDEKSEEIIEYFDTTIDETEILTDVAYSFSIRHRYPELKVKSIVVTVNDLELDNFQGKCRLQEGTNSIAVRVSYEKKDGSTVSQKRLYHVTVELSEIAISTNLRDGRKVDQPSFTFYASAKRKDQGLPVSATCNGKKLTSDHTDYACELQEGDNTILLSAKDEFGEKKATYLILYEKKVSRYSIETNLINCTVSSANLEFSAKGYVEGSDSKEKSETELKANVNGAEITGDKGSYHATLEQGINTIILTVGEDKAQVHQTYEVEYVPEISDPEADDPSLTAPKLVTDLVDDSTITGNVLSFYIRPVSYQGERIRGQNVVVTCNDEVIPCVWDDSTTTSYRMTLVSGDNSITITPTDKEGHSMTFPYVIHCNRVEDGESLGHVTLSIEATTIGLGNLIEPTQVEIFEGVNAAKMLTGLLEEAGYGYTSTGSVDSGFYLASIKGSGISDGASVNDELMQCLEEAGDSEFDLDKHDSDSLGEFDFSKGSGWMYSVNGNYPNYGFSDCYPHDGDVIRVRFTLYYGKDIGGGYAMGDGDEENWGDW